MKLPIGYRRIAIIGAALLITVGASLAGASAIALAHTDETLSRAVVSTEPTTASQRCAAIGTIAALPPEAAASTEAFTSVNSLTTVLTDTARNRTMSVSVTFPSTGGPYPLVVFAHGYAASAADYDALTDELARAGFVVAAPDFPYSSRAATASPVRDYHAQAIDVSFVIDRLTDRTGVPDVASHVDAGQIAVVGHSDGGITAAGVAFNSEVADPRIGAAVVMSGASIGFVGSWFDTPQQPALLVLHGTNDEVNPLAASESMYQRAGGTKMLVEIDGGTHAGPFMSEPTVADVARVVADFLQSNLQRSPDAARHLGTDANVAPLFDAS